MSPGTGDVQLEDVTSTVPYPLTHAELDSSPMDLSEELSQPCPQDLSALLR